MGKKFKFLKVVLLGWLVGNPLSFAQSVPTPHPPPASVASDVELIFGIIPEANPAVLRQSHAPLMDYLSQQLNKKVILYVAASYEELTDKIKARQVHVGHFGAVSYVKAKQAIPDLKYLLTLKKMEGDEVRDHYFGKIIALKESGLKTLEDIKGKRFAFTDYQSSSGYVYPVALLKKQGIDPDQYFSHVFMLKKHDRIIDALLHHSIDAGAIWDRTLAEAIHQHGDLFQIIIQTDPIPNEAYAAGAHTPDRDCQIIQQSLVELTPISPLLVAMRQQGYTYSGWIIRSDQFYDVVRQAYLPPSL